MAHLEAGSRLEVVNDVLRRGGQVPVGVDLDALLLSHEVDEVELEGTLCSNRAATILKHRLHRSDEDLVRDLRTYTQYNIIRGPLERYSVEFIN